MTIYMQAAKWLDETKHKMYPENPYFCCWALNRLASNDAEEQRDCDATRQFAELFSPSDVRTTAESWFGEGTDPVGRKERIIALLLMHQIVSNPQEEE